jgi:hypothetical protein
MVCLRNISVDTLHTGDTDDDDDDNNNNNNNNNKIHSILGLNFDSYLSKFSTADGRFIQAVPHLGEDLSLTLLPAGNMHETEVHTKFWWNSLKETTYRILRRTSEDPTSL